MSEGGLQDISFVSEPFFGGTMFYLELVRVGATDVGQFHMLQITPDVLLRVELGRIGRKPLQLQPFASRSAAGRRS